MVKRLYNPRNIWQRSGRSTFPPLSDMCVCMPRHLVAPAGFANATVWVTLQQFAPHLLVLVLKCYFFTGSASAYGLPPSCCCFHRYCCFIYLLFLLLLLLFESVLFSWLCLTALNCCTPGFF